MHHPLLLAAIVRAGISSGARAVQCAADISAASLAWMRDHAVQGRPLLPGAAMFEVTAALMAACTPLEGGQPAATVSRLAILAPCLLPEAAGGGTLLLRCTLDSRSGALEVFSGRTVHMQGTAAAAHVHGSISVVAEPSVGSLALAPLLSLPASRAQGHNFAAVTASDQENSG